jgi:putative phosphoesterase
LPDFDIFRAENKTVFCTHGHCLGVKYGFLNLFERAKETNADIALFGHTHEPLVEYEDGLWLFNPGSIHEHSYGFADITPAGIVCVHMAL